MTELHLINYYSIDEDDPPVEKLVASSRSSSVELARKETRNPLNDAIGAERSRSRERSKERKKR